MRKLKIAIVVVVVLASLVAAFYAFELWRGKRAWARYQSEAQQRGAKLWLEDFLPPTVPDAQNFASIPIFQRAFAALPGTDNAFAFPPDFEEPRNAKEREQEPFDLAAWQAAFVKAGMLPGGATADPAADVLRALESYEPALTELREAATWPGCRFPMDPEKGFLAPLPHLTVIGSARTILGLQAESHLVRGNATTAHEHVRLCVKLATALGREPLMLSGLVRGGFVTTLADIVWSGLTRDAWDDAMLARIADDLRPMRPLAWGRFAIESERGGFNLWMRGYRAEIATRRESFFDGFSFATPWFGPVYPSGWVYQNQVAINRLTDEALVRFSPDVDLYRLVPDSRSEYDPDKQMVQIFYAPMVILQMPRDLERFFVARHALNEQTRLACALARFRRARGEFPTQLGMLVPEFAPAIPRDVMGGEPLRYRRTEDGGYVLYSIALNLQDDGAPPMNPKRTFDRQDDWVWRMPGKPNQ